MTTKTDDDKALSLLSIREDQVTFDLAQRKALVDVLRVRHATEADMAVFFHQSRRVGLDPFLRQIYMIARQEWDSESQSRQWRQTFQTGIDGFRVVAHRRAKQLRTEITYDDTLYYDSEGKEFKVWVSSTPPAVIRVTVRLGTARYPFDARYEEYVPLKDEYEPDTWEEKNGQRIKIRGKATGNKVPQGMWATRPTSQLEKCAEAGALRRACPQDLSGIYEFAEMNTDLDSKGRAVIDVEAVEVTPSDAKATSRDWLEEIAKATEGAQLNEIWQACKDAGEKDTTVDAAIAEAVARIRAASEPAKPEESESSSEESAKQEGPVGHDGRPLCGEPTDWPGKPCGLLPGHPGQHNPAEGQVATPSVEKDAEPTPGVDMTAAEQEAYDQYLAEQGGAGTEVPGSDEGPVG